MRCVERAARTLDRRHRSGQRFLRYLDADRRVARHRTQDAAQVEAAFAGKQAFRDWTGQDPGAPATGGVEPGTVDTLTAHPVYGHLGWLAVVDPGPRTDAVTRELLAEAHAKAKARYERRHADT